jgi:uncharacterized protein with HEPN domain
VDDFLDSNQLQDAAIRRIEIIGEATKKLPQDFKEQHSEIPWKEMAGMRDIVVHEYFRVYPKLTWRVATEDIEGLKVKLNELK